jgi:hypothetical protein
MMNTIPRTCLSLALCLGYLLNPCPVAVADDARGLLIVAPERFIPALTDFVAYKRTLLPTTIHSLEKLIAENQGVDDPEKLKRSFHRKWKDENLGYVLLVGRCRRAASPLYGARSRHTGCV